MLMRSTLSPTWVLVRCAADLAKAQGHHDDFLFDILDDILNLGKGNGCDVIKHQREVTPFYKVTSFDEVTPIYSDAIG